MAERGPSSQVSAQEGGVETAWIGGSRTWYIMSESLHLPEDETMRFCDGVQSMKSTIEVELIGNDAKSHALKSLIKCLLSQNAKAFLSTILKSDTDTMKPPISCETPIPKLF
jgi:hypothetical protein